MKRRTIIYVIMLFVAVTTVNAQSVTKIHENDIMNQFLTMETGAGALTPAAYYNTFHKSYQRDANVRNKLIYRTSVMADANEEKAPAEKIDSDYVARAKIEALNIESRSKATDITWFSEKTKINGKLEIFNRNISRIVTSGGTSEDYRTWRNIYNCIETAIKYTQDSYLDMGQRKKEFLAIYRDIIKRNNLLVQQLQVWRGGKRAQELLANKTKIQRISSTKVVAQNALRRWQTAFGTDGTATGR